MGIARKEEMVATMAPAKLVVMSNHLYLRRTSRYDRAIGGSGGLGSRSMVDLEKFTVLGWDLLKRRSRATVMDRGSPCSSWCGRMSRESPLYRSRHPPPWTFLAAEQVCPDVHRQRAERRVPSCPLPEDMERKF